MSKATTSPSDCRHPLAYSVTDAAISTGLGRTTIYKLITTGRLPVVKIGGRTLVRHDALLALLEAPVAANDSAPSPKPAPEKWNGLTDRLSGGYHETRW